MLNIILGIFIYIIGYILALFLFLYFMYRCLNTVSNADVIVGAAISIGSWLTVISASVIILFDIIKDIEIKKNNGLATITADKVTKLFDYLFKKK